jgi:hypothetical protein
MTAVRAVGAAALLALAVLVALLAADVRSWQDSLETGDAVYAATPSRADWTPRTRLGGAAEKLLGTQDDVSLRRALAQFRATVGVRARLDNVLEVQTARARAEDALAQAARRGDRGRAAQARTLLGILTFGSAARGSDQTRIEAAQSDFADAVRADPSNDDAKYDLELLYRLTAAQGVRPGKGTGGATGRAGRRGGGGTPGRGY